ncbi:hypothetical protein JHK82_018735 [Glycine max]|uniref:Uncharacterized protein n=2 Tax=Glycine subgen. Soja TaxID=1462606 RepID=A0A0R0J3T9_SOYBN|nr:hypothetical protein JHK85_019177 [Glycine max]KAG5037918.1 hypothetical protein JHK86_018758 [Glycine max]KAG5143040.1 hypothetical protein JHK82_018735 [Glycine max]KRH49502.1 hypothetical protein GLYMA_07G159500v4 [Glycine max]RZC03151.1 hypothetical protein D0Y65_017994 [Glycine soja]
MLYMTDFERSSNKREHKKLSPQSIEISSRENNLKYGENEEKKNQGHFIPTFGEEKVLHKTQNITVI